MNFCLSNSLIELVSFFNSDEVCRNFIKVQRWSNTVFLPLLWFCTLLYLQRWQEIQVLRVY